MDVLRRLFKHPDTARCVQGCVIVSQELVKAQARNGGAAARLGAHKAGVNDVVSFLVNRTAENEVSAMVEKTLEQAQPVANHVEELLSEKEIEKHSDDLKIRSAGEEEKMVHQESIPVLTSREQKVPATRIGRVLGFGQLAAGLAVGSINELVGRQFRGESADDSNNSILLSEANSERIASTLCRMRGAALKLGQMMSIQDDSVLPPQLAVALDRVRQGADRMPKHQLETMMSAELGEDWRGRFETFDDIPFAAASLGQVHRAVVKDTGERVAVKVQFPGVAESIDSDLANLRRLAAVTGIFPKGLFIDRIIDVMKQELREECDYVAEAKHQGRFRELLANESDLYFVPKVFTDLSSSRVLTTQFAEGIPIDKAANAMPQSTRNSVGRRLLHLTLRELFEFRYMQTDPNFSNYLYDSQTDRIVLLDFGATRQYGREFVDDYIELVWAASRANRTQVRDLSIQLGFLTGHESLEMINAHIEAGLEVGRPFQRSGEFDFRQSKITQQMGKHGDTFMNDRLTPPPQEVYSLHRKLSGAYMTCVRIGAIFPCRDLLEKSYEQYHAEKTN
mmetsp:Transcript_16121/g.26334  ORF Transcript_16121/g.26334 Transcript_16121/m.26334 type:complete len:565 (+) Transcript_16121:155-1849(+)